jgi:DNA helicase-2/ATP-dependent DNA helicase PcrA
MQRLLVTKFPFLLIDESQDTAKLLIEAFFVAQANFKSQFCLGLFGDTMQRIYTDGKVDLGQNLPNDWKKPAKVMNHRCPKRVVRLINKIREETDGIQQEARTDAPEGFVRLFTALNTAGEKESVESAARLKMAEITGDNEWAKPERVKALILEHHMAATRLGFIEMFEHLGSVDHFQTGLRDGSLPLVRFFSAMVYPLIAATKLGNRFAATTIVRNYSPLLSPEAFKKSGNNQLKQVQTAKAAVEKLMLLFGNGREPTFLEVLTCVQNTSLFEIPDALNPFVGARQAEDDEDHHPNTDTASKTLEAIRNFLNTRFSQIGPYTAYVSGKTEFTTHQGVKGLEFPRVLVIMDDADAGGFLFSYDKLFGAKEKTANDLKNEREQKETSIDRTRRLFYVTCSRAQSSLALVAYTNDTTKVKEQVISKGWFDQQEMAQL